MTITGTNLANATKVYFGTTAATNVTPLGDDRSRPRARRATAGIVNVTVVAPGGTSATSANDQFTYMAAPTVTKVSPTGGLWPAAPR